MRQPDFSIRKASPGDTPAIERLRIDAWRTAYRGLVPSSYLDRLDPERGAERLRLYLAERREDVWVAESEGRLAGFVMFGPSRDGDASDEDSTGEIRGLYVAPESWRRGIGKALCACAESHSLGAGFAEISLWVLKGNAHARRFYESRAFFSDGAEKRYLLGEFLPAVRYRKRLERPA